VLCLQKVRTGVTNLWEISPATATDHGSVVPWLTRSVDEILA